MRIYRNTGKEQTAFADLGETTRKMANMRKNKEIIIHSGNVQERYSDYRTLINSNIEHFIEEEVHLYEVVDVALSRVPKIKLGRKIRNRPR